MRKKTAWPGFPRVDVYRFGSYVTSVEFRYKWQARLFHILLNASINERTGVRKY